MKNQFFLLFIVLIIGCTTNVKLFTNKKANWNEVGGAQWSFSNHEIVGLAGEDLGYITTNRTYSNFILELEFLPDSTINSGIFLRCKDEQIAATTCYEVNIWDLHPNQDFRTGSIVTRTKPLQNLETIGTWNKYKIECKDKRTKVWLNGMLTADIIEEELKNGIIALQAAGKGEIKFRNIRIRELN